LLGLGEIPFFGVQPLLELFEADKEAIVAAEQSFARGIVDTQEAVDFVTDLPASLGDLLANTGEEVVVEGAKVLGPFVAHELLEVVPEIVGSEEELPLVPADVHLHLIERLAVILNGVTPGGDLFVEILLVPK